MEVIFLDVDGVLKSIRNYALQHGSAGGLMNNESSFDPECLSNLKKLIEITDSKIVITSTLRKTEDGLDSLYYEFMNLGISKRIIGETPIILIDNKSLEIEQFLIDNEFIERFIILDDEYIEGFEDRLILTNPYTGLTEENVKNAIIILMEQRNNKVKNKNRRS